MQNYHKNPSKYPKPAIPANKKIPKPLAKVAMRLKSIKPQRLKIQKWNRVGGKPKLAKIK